MIKKTNILLVLILVIIGAKAQENKSMWPQVTVSYNSYGSTGEALPFWFTSNQNGAFMSDNNYYQLLRAGFVRELDAGSNKKWDFTYGTTLIAGYGDSLDYQFNQYWIGARFKWAEAKFGARNDTIRFGGLSHSNGNMMWSGNARPLPGVTFSTHSYIPLIRKWEWLTIKALYEENFLWDDRDMMDAMLHHKYLYTRATLKSWKLTLGLDHWVYWGGTSRYHGETPGIEYYCRYVLALKGGEQSSSSDQINAAGNSIGMYVIEAEKDFKGNKLTFYWNHPFEDRSGLEMENYPDGLFGLHFGLKKRDTLFSNFVYEFMNTMDQSGSYHLIPTDVPGVKTGRGRDNYFALGLGMSDYYYSSGHVHYNKMMGTPLFIPVIGADGMSKGFDNTSMLMHHFGIGGTLAQQLTWKLMLTWSRSFGTYEYPYPEPLEEFSWLGECHYQLKHLPLKFSLGVAGDTGERFEERIGGNLGMKWGF